MVEPFNISGPLFKDVQIAAALADDMDDGVFESLMLRGLIDE